MTFVIENGAMTGMVGLALFFILGTVLPLFSHDHWAIRIFDFPRVQISVGAAVTLGGLLVLGPSSFEEYAVVVVLGACLVYQIDHILPYTPLAPTQVRTAAGNEGESISLLVCNVERPNRDAESVLTLIEDVDPDLFLALETDSWWIEKLRDVEVRCADALTHPREDEYGMALYSKLPLVGPEVRFLVEEDVPSIHTGIKLPSGAMVFLHGLHPRPPHPTHGPDTTERDAELLYFARQVQDRDAPVIVAGDLNDVSWSYTARLFQNVSGLLDPRIGRGTYNTFHARYPLFRYPLDHVFHSSDFRLAELEVLPYVGSDHFPVYVELRYDAEAPEDHAEPTVDDVEEAQVQRELDKLYEKRKERGPSASQGET